MNGGLLVLLALASAPATAAPPGPAGDPAAPPDVTGTAIGFELDLLPPVMSAAAGAVGFSAQAWAGVGSWRVRLLAARLRYLDSLVGSDAFRDMDTTAAAVVCDRFFQPGFRGPWVGGGAELWWSSVGHPAGPSRAAWTDAVLTLGAGYVWKVAGEVYLNPFAAAHWAPAERSVTLYGDVFRPRRLSGEVSLKIGWSFRP
jgi:hypothetical protein